MLPKLPQKLVIPYLHHRSLLIFLISKPFLIFFLPCNYAFVRKFQKELIFRFARLLIAVLSLIVILSSLPFKNLSGIFLSGISLVSLIFTYSIREITKSNFKSLLVLFSVQSFTCLELAHNITRISWLEA